MSRIPFQVGDILYGFCDGCFGRDSYDTKRVEAIGDDWVVARGVSNGIPFFANFDVTEMKDWPDFSRWLDADEAR